MSPVRQEIMFINKFKKIFINYGVFILCCYPCLPILLAINYFTCRVGLVMIFKILQEVWSKYRVLNQKFPSGIFYKASKEIHTEKLFFHKQQAELITSHSNLPQFKAINRPMLWFCTSPWLMTLRSSAMQTMDPCHCYTEVNQVTGNVLPWVVILISGNYRPTLLANILKWMLVVIKRIWGNSLVTLLSIFNNILFLELYLWVQTMYNSLIILFLSHMLW